MQSFGFWLLSYNLSLKFIYIVVCVIVYFDLFACCACLVARSCLTLCDPLDCSSPGSSVHGMFETKIQVWVAISSFRGSSGPRDWTRVSWVSCIAGRFLTTEPWGRPISSLLYEYATFCTPFSIFGYFHF